MLKKIISNKLGLILGAVIACLLVFYLFLLFAKGGDQEKLLTACLWYQIIMSIVIGGIISGFIVDRYIIRKSHNRWQTWGVILGATIIIPFTFKFDMLLGYVVGGLLIGGIIQYIFGLGDETIYICMRIGFAVAIILVECFGAILGSILGDIGQRIVKRD